MEKNSKKNSTAGSQVAAQQAVQRVEEPNEMSAKKKRIHVSKKTRLILLSVVYGVLDVVTALTAISVIVLSTIAALAVKAFMSQKQDHRIAGLITICITGAVTISACIYGLTALCRKKKKIMNLHNVSIMLLVLATLQLIIAGTSLLVDETDMADLNSSLRQSFQNFDNTNSLDHKQWTSIEYSLKCCGLDGPADHRNAMIPGNNYIAYIPISCCPAYDPSKSEILQLRELQTCKMNNLFYKNGCKEKLNAGLVDAAAREIHIIIGIVILEYRTTIALEFWTRTTAGSHRPPSSHTTSLGPGVRWRPGGAVPLRTCSRTSTSAPTSASGNSSNPLSKRR